MKSDGGKMARKRIKDYKEEASLVGYIQIDNKFKNKRVYVWMYKYYYVFW